MPTTVNSIAKLGAVLVKLPPTFEPNDSIGGRSSGLLPAVQSQLRTQMPQISAALHATLPAVQLLDVFGVGTSPGIIAILIGLLRDKGFQANLALCDGSVRPGFSGPSAVFRAAGGSPVGVQFIQKVGAALQGH